LFFGVYLLRFNCAFLLNVGLSCRLGIAWRSLSFLRLRGRAGRRGSLNRFLECYPLNLCARFFLDSLGSRPFVHRHAAFASTDVPSFMPDVVVNDGRVIDDRRVVDDHITTVNRSVKPMKVHENEMGRSKRDVEAGRRQGSPTDVPATDSP